jgi:hypothetical protein
MKYVIPDAEFACDVFCIMPVMLNTLEDGAVYLFLTVDVATTYIVQNEVEIGDDIEYLLKHIQKLMENPQLQLHKPAPFTIVLPQYEAYADQIEALIEPHGGSLAINEEYMALVMNPVVDELSRHMSPPNDN